MSDTATVAQALEPLATTLAADDYRLTVTAGSVAGRSVSVEVAAGPAACADCLVPKTIFGELVRRRLAGVAPGAWTIDIAYPADV
jgi:hypothetical protein